MGLSLAMFVASGVLIFVIGPQVTKVAEELATATGLGQAIGGAVLLGLSTSIGGTTVSLTAAARGDAELALSNGLGGIAAQTAFLAVADCFLRKKNLEYAAASAANMFQLGLLILLLGLIVVAFAGPDVTVWHLHPISIILPLVWILGLIVTRRSKDDPGWIPRRSPSSSRFEDNPDDGAETDEDADDGVERTRSLTRLWVLFLLFGSGLALGGLGLSVTAPAVSEATGLSSSAVGVLLTATVTSLPELVTTIAAVRRGALTLAVGDIVGGNAFDTLFSAIADGAYLGGSIYHAASTRELFATALGIVLSGILMMGLLGREKVGPAGVGWESLTILIVYAAGMGVLVTM